MGRRAPGAEISGMGVKGARRSRMTCGLARSGLSWKRDLRRRAVTAADPIRHASVGVDPSASGRARPRARKSLDTRSEHDRREHEQHGEGPDAEVRHRSTAPTCSGCVDQRSPLDGRAAGYGPEGKRKVRRATRRRSSRSCRGRSCTAGRLQRPTARRCAARRAPRSRAQPRRRRREPRPAPVPCR